MTHVMMDPVLIVSFPDPNRSKTPLASGAINPGSIIAFSSLEELDAALVASGDTAAFLNPLTVNDKIYRLRKKIEDGDVDPFGSLPTVETDTTDPTDEVRTYGTVWINTVTPEAFQTNGNGTWTSIWDGSV